jgi:signal transduction histidine kinase
MEIQTPEEEHLKAYLLQIKKRSDMLMNYFLFSYFAIGLLLALYYDTWNIAFGVGGLSLTAYYSSRYFLPQSNQYQYVLSTVYGIFMGQFIYQMHGMFEMHFFAFIGSAILITYQDWKLQIPLALVVIVHHATFGYLQYIGYSEIYFTQLDYMTLETFIIHGILATAVFFLCGLWAYNFRKYGEIQTRQSFEIGQLHEADKQKETFIAERKAAEDQLLELLNITTDQNKRLQNFAYIVSHNIRSHSANITGLVNSIAGAGSDEEKLRLFNMLQTSKDKLSDTIENLNEIITIQNDTNRPRREMDLREEVVKSLDSLSILIPQADIAIINNVPEGIRMNAIPSYIESILLNLLTNAIKYRSPDRKAFIEINGSNNGNEVELSVKDNGIGIDLERHGDKLFGMYKTFSSNPDARGLGLFITKNQVEAMDGRIDVESTFGVGTTFSVLFQG